jgi:hypothetical protein
VRRNQRAEAMPCARDWVAARACFCCISKEKRGIPIKRAGGQEGWGVDARRAIGLCSPHGMPGLPGAAAIHNRSGRWAPRDTWGDKGFNAAWGAHEKAARHWGARAAQVEFAVGATHGPRGAQGGVAGVKISAPVDGAAARGAVMRGRPQALPPERGAVAARQARKSPARGEGPGTGIAWPGRGPPSPAQVARNSAAGAPV